MNLADWIIEPCEDGSLDVWLSPIPGSGAGDYEAVRVESPVTMDILMRLIVNRSSRS